MTTNNDDHGQTNVPTSTSTRRDFMKTTTATTLAAAAGATAAMAISPAVRAAGSDIIKVGLIGCGGRGTGAAVNALNADSATQLVAMGDAFEHHLNNSHNALKNNGQVGDRVTVKDDHKFVGFDAYKGVIDMCDVVCHTSTPHFRPIHLKYAVEKGVHNFVEKPVATDAPMLCDIWETCRLAKQKNLAVVSGLCWRYDPQKSAVLEKVLDGAVGDIVSIETVYNAGGVWAPRRTREQVGSDMELQLWNWYYYNWLSGDHIAEQAIHSIDKMSWAMGDKPPIRAWGVGGRQVRTAPEYGNIYDHFAVVYEYENGVKGYHVCRHWPNTPGGTQDHIMGTKGVADVFGHRIRGQNEWRYPRNGPKGNMYQIEHDHMFASIRAGEPINNGDYMCTSTLLALMGRDACYTGQVITWDDMMKSNHTLAPKSYEWGDAPQRPVPIPGVTKFA